MLGLLRQVGIDELPVSYVVSPFSVQTIREIQSLLSAPFISDNA